MTKSIWLLVSGGLILLGVAMFALQPGPPEPVCATDPNATSGFTDPEQDCPISIDSMNAIRNHESAPKLFRIAGLTVGAAGLVLAIATGIPETCAPVTYTPTGPQLLCDTKDQHPQTYQGNQGDTTYYKKNLNKKLHGAFVLPNDTQDANRGDAVQQAIAQQNGVKVDQSVTASGRDPQSVYTPRFLHRSPSLTRTICPRCRTGSGSASGSASGEGSAQLI